MVPRFTKQMSFAAAYVNLQMERKKLNFKLYDNRDQKVGNRTGQRCQQAFAISTPSAAFTAAGPEQMAASAAAAEAQREETCPEPGRFSSVLPS